MTASTAPALLAPAKRREAEAVMIAAFQEVLGAMILARPSFWLTATPHDAADAIARQVLNALVSHGCAPPTPSVRARVGRESGIDVIEIGVLARWHSLEWIDGEGLGFGVLPTRRTWAGDSLGYRLTLHRADIVATRVPDPVPLHAPTRDEAPDSRPLAPDAFADRARRRRKDRGFGKSA